MRKTALASSAEQVEYQLRRVTSDALEPDTRYARCANRLKTLSWPRELTIYRAKVIDSSPPKCTSLMHVVLRDVFLSSLSCPASPPRYALRTPSLYYTRWAFPPRARGTPLRPTVAEVYEYRAHVDQHMASGIARFCADRLARRASDSGSASRAAAP